MTKKTYNAAAYTGAWFKNGLKELAYTCCQGSHRTIEAARRCGKKDQARNTATRQVQYTGIAVLVNGKHVDDL